MELGVTLVATGIANARGGSPVAGTGEIIVGAALVMHGADNEMAGIGAMATGEVAESPTGQ
jgi:hypothetical protein